MSLSFSDVRTGQPGGGAVAYDTGLAEAVGGLFATIPRHFPKTKGLVAVNR